MKRRISLIIAALIFLPATASAHVLVKDTSGFNGAIIHFAPVDDPIAGEPSEIFIDLQNGITAETYALTLSVAPHGKWATVIPIHAKGSTISSKYTFPSQGKYDLVLLAEPIVATGPVVTFNYAQDVSRGTGPDANSKPTPKPVSPWAIAGIAGASAALVILIVLAYRKRKTLGKR